jgi:hypothetical protein
MKKIGIILDSLSCSKYLYDTVSDISNNPNIELYFLLNKDRDISSLQRVLEYLFNKILKQLLISKLMINSLLVIMRGKSSVKANY